MCIRDRYQRRVHGELERNTFYFGKYSSVYIGHLKKIKLRYLVNFNELAKFVTYFNSLKNPPLILIIDDLLEFLNDEENDDRKSSKMAYIISQLNAIGKMFYKDETSYNTTQLSLIDLEVKYFSDGQIF
eukprot:TRINITY_DN2558_c0_g1_i1.p1 TRINITY_DN2558_c0_g1~~TRINITY_DN2558_c0_g1_i1.p1  ORF type:complete len:129 (-),score=24.54 TRINITY_DN2558_c0_g1_i1:387-773(-)